MGKCKNVLMIPHVKHIICAVFILICLDSRTGLLANPLLITQEQDIYPLDSHVFFYEDTDRSYSINTISVPENTSLFSPVKSNVVSSGYSRSAYWTRIILHNTMATPVAISLEEKYPLIANISFYLVQEDNVVLKTLYTGRDTPIPNRTVAAASFVFPFELPPGTSTLYIRGTSDGALTFKYELATQTHRNKILIKNQSTSNTLLGILGMSAIISLMFAIALKNKSYGYLAGVNITLLYFLTSMAGMQPFYLPIALTQQFSFVSIPFFSTLFMLLNAQFTLVFLNITKKEPVLYGCLIWMRNVMFVMVVVVIFLPYSYTVCIIAPYGILLLLFPTIGIVKIIRKNIEAIYYTSGLTTLIIGALITALARADIISFDPGLESIGAILQILLMQASIAGNTFRLSKKQVLLQRRLLDTQARIITEQKILTESYSRFVPHNFVENLGKTNIVDVNVGDYRKTDMFILFTDLRGFSKISHGMLAEKIFEFVNILALFLTPRVYGYGGLIDKYTGDGILAIYPIAAPSKVIQSSIEMQRGLKEFEQSVQHITHHEIRMGIGINSGEVTLGMVGDKSRIDATVMGSVVNISAKIEQLNKAFWTHTLITEDTYSKIENPDDFSIRALCKTHAIKDVGDTIKLYEIFDADPDEQKAQKLATRDMFQEAMTLLDNNQINKGVTLLEECIKKSPLDIPAQNILQQAKKI